MRLLTLWRGDIIELGLIVLMILRDGMMEELLRLIGLAATSIHPFSAPDQIRAPSAKYSDAKNRV